METFYPWYDGNLGCTHMVNNWWVCRTSDMKRVNPKPELRSLGLAGVDEPRKT